MIKTEKLEPQEVGRFKEIRLRSLKEDPDAFGTTHQQALEWDDQVWIDQAANIPTFIANVDSVDRGIVRVGSDLKDPTTGWVISMWVDQQARGRGVGVKLLSELIQWCEKQTSFKVLKLDVGDYNEAAIRLYEKIGFRSNGVTGSLPEPRTHITEHQKEFKLNDE